MGPLEFGFSQSPCADAIESARSQLHDDRKLIDEPATGDQWP
jgi:hypothetical protein